MVDKGSLQDVILIIDDNPTNLGLLGDYLSSSGFHVLVANSGERAIQQVDRLPPDLILLDIVMPGLDGFETCRRLKDNPATRDIPIIFMTALSDVDTKMIAFELGAVDYITKPFHQEEVLARINAHLTIEHQKQQLTALNATKDKFFSIISHDLKNAFHSVTGFATLLYESFETLAVDDARTAIDSLYRSADNTSRLLENLLHWASLQRGRMSYQPKKIKIAAVIADQITLLGPNAVQKEVTLSTAVVSEVEVCADLAMLETILRNLMSNAIKFTRPGGKVVVSAAPTGEMVAISVVDTGIGIGDQYIERLFDLTQSYKRYGTAQEKGTGLGLILCHELVRRNGGEIWVESEVNCGTTVTFTLPLAETGEPIKNAPP